MGQGVLLFSSSLISRVFVPGMFFSFKSNICMSKSLPSDELLITRLAMKKVFIVETSSRAVVLQRMPGPNTLAYFAALSTLKNKKFYNVDFWCCFLLAQRWLFESILWKHWHAPMTEILVTFKLILKYFEIFLTRCCWGPSICCPICLFLSFSFFLSLIR